MVWDSDYQLTEDRIIRVPWDIKEVFIDDDPDRGIAETGELLIIILQDDSEYEYTYGDDPEFDEVLDELLCPT